jgi:hypothetical protein
MVRSEDQEVCGRTRTFGVRAVTQWIARSAGEGGSATVR